jgi:CAAX protease family protein
VANENESETNDRGKFDRGHVFVAAVLFEGALAPIALGLGWLLGQDPLERFAWEVGDLGWGVVATLPMLAMLHAGMRWPLGPLARVKRFFDEELAPLLGGRPDSDLALLSVAAGVGEEMLFRGVFQGASERWFGTGLGLAVSSLLFGLLHPITPTYVLIAGLLGAYLGALWILTGNLLVVIVAHALYDFLALRLVLPRPDAEALESDG